MNREDGVYGLISNTEVVGILDKVDYQTTIQTYINAIENDIDTKMSSMFLSCSRLRTIYVGAKWTTANAETTNMFKSCGTSKVTRK